MNHYLIIGGGIIGMLSARELATAGAKVTLLERQQTGHESSWAGGGIVSPLYPWRYADSVTALASWSQHYFQQLSEELTTNTGIDPQWTQNGLLIISPEENRLSTDWANVHTKQVQIIGPSDISNIEPALVTDAPSAIWMSDVAQIRNPRLAQALKAEIVRLGVEVLEHTPADQIITKQGRFDSLKTKEGSLRADALVVCAGAWTGELLKDLPHRPEVSPVRGQMILFKTDPGVISRITLEEDRYIIPRRDGRVLFGSTIEHTGFEKQTTPEALAELQQIALTRFPVLQQYPIEKQWAGLRPGSPHGIPYIGEHPDIKGLFVNAGHFRNGVVLGPASSRLIADLVLERYPILPPTPYGLEAPRD
ncbi:MAG: glycine oxidase ThiO [Chromatiales bacterium]|nr:glycine oxidase ThiO [Chromatiales bacterium]